MIDLTAEQNEVVNGIMAWIKDDKKPIAILRGSAGTGKTTLLKAVVEKLSESKKTYSLLAPTGRAARILGKKTGKQSKTIHSEIYELGDIKADDDSDAIQGELDSPGFVIPFRLKNAVDAKATIYIIDESSMVSDKTTQNEILSFGSGRLLHDLLYYARIITAKKVKSKVLFVGDEAQLPPVKCTDSPALDKRYFLSEFRLDSELFQLDKVLRQADGSLILTNAERIRRSIFEKSTTSFSICEDGFSVRKVNSFQAIRGSPAERDTGHSAIITVSNKDALAYNMAIRKERFGNAQVPIQNGDILLVCRNSTKSKFYNGDLLTVLNVDPKVEIRAVNVKGGDKVELRYRTVLVRSVDDEKNESNQECKVIENLLYAPNPTLSLLENRATMVDFRKRHPDLDINSDEFKQRLLEDPYFNALLVKFGYSITCHKAQGGEWDNVYVKFSGFPNRDTSFYRWVYTAITRGRNALGVIDAPTFGQDNLTADSNSSVSEDERMFCDDTDTLGAHDSDTVADNPLPEKRDNDKRGEKWSSSEDEQLRSEYLRKLSIFEIATAHGRTQGAITSRITRLGLDVIPPLSRDLSGTHKENHADADCDNAQPPSDKKNKPRAGAWKNDELEKVFGIWELSKKDSTSIKFINSQMGRSSLAIIIQLYKADLLTIMDGDLLCQECECANTLSELHVAKC